MNASTFDTLTAARDLEAVGIKRRQAEAHAEALRLVASASRDELATRADVAGLRAEIARPETRPITLGIGLTFGAAGLAVAGIKLL